MNTEIWNSKNGFVNMDKMVTDFSIFAANHCTSSQFQITIEPSVPNTTTVFFCTDLDCTIVWLITSLFNADTWRVCMGTNDCETIIWLPFTTNCKSSDTWLITCYKEFVTWFYIPMITLNKKKKRLFSFHHLAQWTYLWPFFIVGSFEHFSGFINGMIWWGWCVDII